MADLIPSDDGRTPTAGELAEAQYAMRPELRSQIEDAMDALSPLAYRDCYGGYTDKDPCDCDPCTAKAAMAKLNRIRLPVVRSLREDRLSHCERVYFDAWVKQNTRQPGLNGGYGTLELILRTQEDEAREAKLLSHHHRQPAYVSQRDMDVATAVVQWFGTNVGRCFIDSCEREWEARRQERADCEHVTHIAQCWTEYREKPLFKRIADGIAEKFVKDDRLRGILSTEICKAMLFAKSKAEVESVESGFGTQVSP